MNKNIIVSQDLASFENLSKLGINNFFTFSNEKWGDMRLVQTKSPLNKYFEVMGCINMTSKYVVYLAAQSNDNVTILNEDNLKVYKKTLNPEFSNGTLKVIPIETDAIVTKESIPLLLAPADCAAIIITGIDRNDGKRFVAFIHAGAVGTALEIHLKALEITHLYYDFKNEELEAFIYPAISGKYYKRDISKNALASIFESEKWAKYLDDCGEEKGINFKDKILDDLKTLNIKYIEDSEADAYELNAEGKFFSQSYLRENKFEERQRSMVGVALTNL